MTSTSELRNSHEDERITSLEVWMSNVINPLLERHPTLQETDLVIEGGVGERTMMAQIVRKAFPGVLYIGTDVLKFNQRLSDISDYEAELQRIITLGDNKVPVTSADCYRSGFIRFLIQRLEAKAPLLVTQNALSAILDEHQSLYLPFPTPDVVIGSKNPYKAQLHLERNPISCLPNHQLHPIYDSHGYIADIASKSEVNWTVDQESPHATLLLRER